MSHKTEIKTELTDLQYMKRALDKLGFTYEEAKEGETLTTVGSFGVNEKVELLITGNGKKSYNKAIGFQKSKDGTYTATGDFWGLKNADGKSLTKEALAREVTASSKEAELIDRLNKLGFDVAQQNEDKDCIELTLERWT